MLSLLARGGGSTFEETPPLFNGCQEANDRIPFWQENCKGIDDIAITKENKAPVRVMKSSFQFGYVTSRFSLKTDIVFRV